jgi:Lipopolysaccharide export system permease LptF/LptG
MTIDHPVRRFLARACGDDTMARIVDPILADMRFECGRPRWRGYVALARALTVYAIASAPDCARRIWTEDEGAVPKTVLACVVTTIVVAAPLIMLPLVASVWPSRISAARTVVLLAPQALILALPASLLVAIPMVFRRVAERRRAVLRSLGIAVVCALATLALIVFVMPEANQAFRVAASGRADIPRGLSEMSLGDLRERIEILNLTPGGVRVARTYEYTYQLRLALGCIALPIWLLASAMTTSNRVRRRPVIIGALAIVVYAGSSFLLDTAAYALFASSASVPAFVAAWLPTATLLLIAAGLGRYRRVADRQPRTAS